MPPPVMVLGFVRLPKSGFEPSVMLRGCLTLECLVVVGDVGSSFVQSCPGYV